MTKQEEIKRVLGLLQEFSLSELKALRKKLAALKPRKVRIPKIELRKFVEQNRSTKAIARYYKVSSRTITRRIKEYNLTGLRPKGRKPAVKRPRAPRPREAWITTKKYFDRLHSTYHFINIRYPAVRYINPKTLVCSNTKSNPKGLFTTVGIYYIVEESNVYFLYQTRIRYSEEPVPFEEIYRWAKENALDMVSILAPKDVFVVQVVAFTFMGSNPKPDRIKVS